MLSPKIFHSINLCLAGLLVLTLALAALIFMLRPTDISPVEVVPTEHQQPMNSFSLKSDDYSAIGEPFLSLNFSPWQMQLPDLQKYLTYYGTNGRPDADQEYPMLHFSLNDSKSQISIPAGERLYLVYDRGKKPATYSFSPNNKPTSLWIEAAQKNGMATVNVSMKDENGKLITTPASRASFQLKEKEFTKTGGEKWEIGKWKVDGTLLARQKARWYGKDLFLLRHGGPEYEAMVNKNRIDFEDGEHKYSIYVSPDDTLVWKDNRWQLATSPKESRAYPLLLVKKIDERIMNFEFWDINGKGKITLNLLKSNDAWNPQNLIKEFSYVGARTRSSFIFEVNQDRMTIQPQDWLIQVDGTWKKITSPEDIDAYLEGTLKGALFVFDDVVKKNDQMMLEGTIFNKSRSAMQRVELPTQQGLSAFKLINENETHSPAPVETPKFNESPPALQGTRPHIPTKTVD